MSKKNVMISIDEFIHKRAQERHFNISEFCEKSLRKEVEGSIDQPAEERKCNSCGALEIDTGMPLIWLCPDERWVCEKCLKVEIKKVTIGVVARK